MEVPNWFHQTQSNNKREFARKKMVVGCALTNHPFWVPPFSGNPHVFDSDSGYLQIVDYWDSIWLYLEINYIRLYSQPWMYSLILWHFGYQWKITRCTVHYFCGRPEPVMISGYVCATMGWNGRIADQQDRQREISAMSTNNIAFATPQRAKSCLKFKWSSAIVALYRVVACINCIKDCLSKNFRCYSCRLWLRCRSCRWAWLKVHRKVQSFGRTQQVLPPFERIFQKADDGCHFERRRRSSCQPQRRK